MKTILIIEDDIDLREGISFSLQSEGYQILTAEKLEDGWKSILKENPDLILLDCNLPDGTAVVQLPPPSALFLLAYAPTKRIASHLHRAVKFVFHWLLSLNMYLSSLNVF